MLPPLGQLRAQLRLVLSDKADQGHDLAGMEDALASLPDSYDAFVAFSDRIGHLPLRDDWPWDEPVELDAWREACRGGRTAAKAAPAADEPVPAADEAVRIETAFLARAAGCVLGKPFEFDPDLAEIEASLEPVGEWPLADYVSEAGVARLRHRIPQWSETARERIRWVAPDDDLNYTLLGMIVLERHGAAFTIEQLRDRWLLHLPIAVTFGPERTMLVRAGSHSLDGGSPEGVARWAMVLNPRDEWCGALIRVDAYGYACPGDPELATELAWRDASFTHRRTGVYAAVFVAAALALAPVCDDPMEMFDGALAFVPPRSRFAAAVADAMTDVASASDWRDGYERVHRRWPEHRHCRIYQEVGTLVNTLRFATDPGDAICKQVMQGNDTDSYGATAGSLAGLFFGPGSLEPRWVAPFQDELRTALALFNQRSLQAVATRMGRLPARLRDAGASEPELPY